jgi:beta-lactamase regulating signal transducer with metallopeptidase domain
MMLELLRNLLALTLVCSASIAIVLSTRHVVRRAFGASVGYGAWLLVPISILALFIPGARDAGYELVIQAQVSPVSSLVTRSLAAPLGSGLSVNWPAWLTAAWGVGAALFVAYVIGLQRAFVKGLGTLSDSRGTLRAESSAGCPALIGVLRPRIVLPRDFETRYTTQEQSLILAHENIHLRRMDSLWNALTALSRCVFWFNPLIHVAASRMRVDQELACDAAVIERHPASRRTYAGAMLKTQLADTALPVGCHWTSTHPFKERLEMIKNDIPTRARRALGGGLLAVTSIVVGYAAWAAEPALAPTPSSPRQIEEAPLPDIGGKNFVFHGNLVLRVAAGGDTVGADGQPLRKQLVRLSGNVPIQMSANTVTPGPNGQQTLEGNVRIVITKPAGAPGHTKRVRKAPTGEVTTETKEAPQTVTLNAEKVVLTPLEDGGVQLESEDGSLEEK